MKKFYLKDGEEKLGPFDLADLRSRNITAETPILEEGQAEWTTAGKLDELKDLFTPVPPPLPTEEPLPGAVVPAATVEPVVTSTAATVTTTVPVTPAPKVKVEKPKPAASGKKSTAWVSWLLTLVILGGAGYFVYQDMEKNKLSGTTKTLGISDTATTATTTSTTQSNTSTASTEDTAGTTATTTTADPTTVTTDPVTTTTTTTATTTTAQQTAAQKAAAKKTEDEKKKKLAAEAQKKADAEKKKLADAQAAAAAREMNFRNKWPNYISFGSLNYNTKGDGIDAFDVPIYNGTDAMLDKVTVRIEYLKKKEKKIFKTETITIFNIPARTTVNGRAPESKKGEKVNVFITGINSRKLHFCYPVNNGNAADPYFCN